jgi:hypothetical protein
MAGMWTIETKDAHGQWRGDTVGEQNAFQCEADAFRAIEDLRRLGEDWARAEYRVVETV